MISLRHYKVHHRPPIPPPNHPWNLRRDRARETGTVAFRNGRLVVGERKLVIRRCSGGGGGGPESDKKSEKRSFLSLEEAGLVEMSGLSTHERFLCRLTISSLNLLRVISEQEGCPIEELNAGRVCDWFIKDKVKRDQNLDSAVLQWDDSNFIM